MILLKVPEVTEMIEDSLLIKNKPSKQSPQST